MKSMSVGIASLLKPRLRLARLSVFLSALALALTTQAQNAVSTLAGSQGTAGYNNATGTSALFNFTNPSGAAVDASGNVYVADAVNNAIRKITSAGVVTTFAGSATGAAGSSNGTGTGALFSGPQGICIDGAGNLYVADTGNHLIRMITSGGVVSTLAGTAGSASHTNGTGAAARFNTPQGIACDRAGAGGAAVNVFVADTQSNAIRQIVVSSGVVTTLAGPAAPAIDSGFVDATNNTARFASPRAIVSSNDGATLYVADAQNHRIRRIAIAAGPTATVSTLAGSGTGAYAEGTGTGASFNLPSGVALSSSGAILVSDTLNQVVRSVTTGGVTSLLAGTPGTSTPFANGLATSATFSIPTGITADATTVYVVDTNNKVVRTIAAATAPVIGGGGQPTAQSVAAGATATFSVSNVSGNPPVSYQWQRSTDSGGSWSNLANGAITGGTVAGATSATLTIASTTTALNGNQFRVVISNGVNPPATSNAVSLTVTQPPVITNGGATFTVAVNTAASGATVVASGTPAPTFAVASGSFPSWANLSTFQSTGQIVGTPTDVVGSPFNFTVTATNSGGTSTAASFTVVVATTTPPQLTGPTNQSVASGGTSASFSVSATGSPSTFTYQWERRASGSGTFTALANGTVDGATYSGVTSAVLSITGITPNMNGDAFRVVVTSTGGSTTSNTATLSVAPIITSPSTWTFVTGQNNDFTFTALGNPAPSISVSISGSLPAGVVFNSPTLSGTPTDGGSSSTFMTVTATNSGGTDSRSFTLNVAPPQAPVITSGLSANFSVNQSGSFTFTATGSPTPTFQLLGSLPAGVTFNSTTGILSGTPTTSVGSPFVLTINAINSAGTASQTFVLTVQGIAPTITTHPSNTTANIGQSATFTAAASGTPTPTLRWQRQPSGTTGFVNLNDDGIYSGTTAATLTIANVTAAMSLDQFRVVATNGTSPDAASNPAQLTVNLGTVITTFAGQAGFFGSTDGTGASARFNSPANIAIDSVGNVYIADTANHVIRKMTSSGVVTTLAGSPNFTGTSDGNGASARFNSPQGIAVDNVGNVYVADTSNHTIRFISTIGDVTTIAGGAGVSGAVDGNGTSARFFGPTALVVDASGNIYVADSSNHAIRRISNTRDVTTLAGVMGSLGFADGNGASARFSTPSGITIDSAGNLYVADSLNQVIRRVTSGGTVTTLAGLAGNAGVTDGVGANARFNHPTGLAVDVSGNLYITDTFSSTLRKLVLSTSDVTTIAGLALSTGFADGAGQTARFNQPIGVAVDFAGAIYIADTRNHTIRRSGSAIAPQIQTHPANQVSAIGGTVSFSASATGAPLPGYQWQRAAATAPDSFVSLTNDGTYSGVSTSTLTVTNVTSAMNGDRFRVIANNGVSPTAASNTALLTVGTAPVFTSATTAQFQAGRAGSFVVTATSDPAATFSAVNLPSWATLNPATGEISGTPPDTSGSPFTVTITATNGIAVTQTLTISVSPAVLPPTVTAQPSSVAVAEGQTTTFSVTVTGTAPFSYQWRRNGFPINGATGPSLSLANIQPSAAGIYSVAVQNTAGAIVSDGATLTVNTLPTFTLQPFSQTALAGSSVTFNVAASGGGTLAYQWRRNGVAIPGATSVSFTIPNVSATEAGNYDVLVSNSLGQVRSSLAQLTLATAAVAPVVVTQPSSRTALAGSSFVLSAGASGAPTPTYQWRRNGIAIAGANSPALTITNAQASDNGTYDVVVTNSQGNATSSPANVRVITRSYAGTYFGSFANSLGNFAMHVRDDNSAVFLGYLPSSSAPVVNTGVIVNDDGSFSFSQAAISGTVSSDDQPQRAAALAAVSVTGLIGSDNTLIGTIAGGANASLAAARSADTGSGQSLAGFYQAGALTNAATSYTIVGANGQAFAVVQSGNASDGGPGTAAANGQITVATSRSVISQTITGGTLIGTSTGVVIASYSGALDAMLARQRLVNISSRARVATGDAVAIAGFVISGEQSKPVLIRAVGPTLGTAPFNVPGALASPRLELFRGSTSLAVNSGIAANRVAIDAAGQQAGAFALGAAGADAAILTTLAPGNYTAVVSSTTNTAGVALVEVYDLSAPSPGQKLLNISTRASAGTNENTLIAGFVVPPGVAKRVLVRGVGPGLTPLGVSGVLPSPSLSIVNLANNSTVAQNSNWSTSADATAISAASVQVGAFTMANADAALIVTLEPGNYTAQVNGANNATGVALIEVYELP